MKKSKAKTEIEINDDTKAIDNLTIDGKGRKCSRLDIRAGFWSGAGEGLIHSVPRARKTGSNNKRCV